MTEPPSTGSVLAKTATGTGWVIGWRVAGRLVGLVNTLVLVRLLLPADFGLVALGASFAQGIDALAMIGIEDAVIRHRAPTPALLDTAFTLGLLRSLLTASLAAALAGPAAAFFAEPRLWGVILTIAAGILIDGLTNIGIVEFRSRFAFDKEFWLWTLPRLASLAFSIGAALLLRSYWALLIGITGHRLLRVLASYVMHPHRPRLTLVAWRELAGYSAWNWALGIVGTLRNNADSVLIGRLMDSTHVGLFALGQELALLPTTELVQPLCRAAFSGFAAVQQSPAAVRETYARIVAGALLVILPAGMGLSLVAAPAVALALGPAWQAAVPLVQIMAVSGCVIVFSNVSNTLFRVAGLMRQTFQVSLWSMAARVLLLLALLPALGLPGAAVAVTLATAAEQALYVGMTLRRFGLTLADLAARGWRIVLAAAGMTAVLALSGLGWQEAAATTLTGRLAELAVPVLAGALTYVAVLLAAWVACGRPAGAEADMLAMLRRIARQR
jgi:O-antigen/teichoic acid export membrane protein